MADDTAPPKSPDAIGTAVVGNDAWLARRPPEQILEPELAIVDPHHHLWDHKRHRYLLDELRADTGSGHRIVATVFVDCMAFYRADGPAALRPVGETEFANGVAAMCASGVYGELRACAGIVSFADLTLGAAVAEVLQAHVAAGGGPAGRFKGIRHAGGWDASPMIHNSHTKPSRGLYGEAGFRQGFAQLAPLGLSFEAWQYHPQLPDVTALARAFPDTAIILNHCGGPLGVGPYAGRGDETFAQWRRDIAELATCPNVNVKLGGLGMRIGPIGHHALPDPPSSQQVADAWRPWTDACIESFGPDRCMFESNFPVDKISAGYAVLWNAFKRLAAGASADEKAALFAGTARRVYRL
ncbi:MAG: amidohydrolase family protein [Burkholderiaceae bacterium]|nr:amidohydrolase family protein [Burkholderiaceae bacterium]